MIDLTSMPWAKTLVESDLTLDLKLEVLDSVLAVLDSYDPKYWSLNSLMFCHIFWWRPEMPKGMAYWRELNSKVKHVYS